MRQPPKPPPPRLVEISANQIRVGDITRDGLVVTAFERGENGEVIADVLDTTLHPRQQAELDEVTAILNGPECSGRVWKLAPVRWAGLDRILVRCPRPHYQPHLSRAGEAEAAGEHQVLVEGRP